MTTSEHPGSLPVPMSKRERLEKHVAWTRERVFLAHNAHEDAQREHKQALTALEAHEGSIR